MIRLSVAVNDPDNGTPTGRVVAIKFGAEWEEGPWLQFLDWSWNLDLGDFEGLPFSESPDRTVVQIAGVPFGVIPGARHVGNWCWDEYSIAEDEADRLISLLRAKRWEADQGDESAWKRWERGEAVFQEEGVHR